ncbi:hypothetical protein Tco_0814402 [Tanacetum coccineum]
MPSPLLPSSGCPTQIQTLRIASTQALINAVTAALPHLHYHHYLISALDMRSGRVLLPDLSEIRQRRSEIAPMTVGRSLLEYELVTLHEHDIQDLYALLEDAQDSRSRISQRVDMDLQRVDLLMGDRMILQETIWMVKEEAYASHEA